MRCEGLGQDHNYEEGDRAPSDFELIARYTHIVDYIRTNAGHTLTYIIVLSGPSARVSIIAGTILSSRVHDGLLIARRRQYDYSRCIPPLHADILEPATCNVPYLTPNHSAASAVRSTRGMLV